jgi:predicted methyltransferase
MFREALAAFPKARDNFTTASISHAFARSGNRSGAQRILWRDTSQAEAEQLAKILDWKPGRTIAEIGAGKGQITIAAAEQVGPTGHVFSTELDPDPVSRHQGWNHQATPGECHHHQSRRN